MENNCFSIPTYKNNLEAFLGDYTNERIHMGTDIPVLVYRLFQYSLKEELILHYGKESAISFEPAAEQQALILQKNI